MFSTKEISVVDALYDLRLECVRAAKRAWAIRNIAREIHAQNPVRAENKNPYPSISQN
jgi:hypothetical protein